MIYVDDRLGSTGMFSVLHSHRSRPQVISRRLPAADFAFPGEGHRGPCMIGIERKRLKDMLNSMRSGRFAGEQIPKLRDHYEHVYLIVEGTWRIHWDSGLLEEPYGKEWQPVILGRQPFAALELQSFLTEVMVLAGVHVLVASSTARTYAHRDRQAEEEKMTAEMVVGLEHFHQKPFEKRHRYVALHTPPQYALMGKASFCRRVAAELAGVGWERSGVVADRFKSVEEMVEAQKGDWAKLPGFGKVLSERVWNQFHGLFEGGDGFE